jgi:hypothetical protein
MLETPMRSRPIQAGAALALLIAGCAGLLYSSRFTATAKESEAVAQADDGQKPAAPAVRKPAQRPAPKRPAAPSVTPSSAPQAQGQPAPAVAGTPAPATPPAQGGGAPETGGAPPQPPAPAPQPPAAQGTNPTGELQAVIHAQNAKVTTCMDNILAQSAAVIDTSHTAISTWVTSAPNDNLFQSIVGLSYPNKGAPNAAAVILAAPLGPNRCQGQTVQVYPTAQPCSAVQAALIKEGHTLGMLQALPVVETKNGIRDVLLPSSGGGCVIVAVALR